VEYSAEAAAAHAPAIATLAECEGLAAHARSAKKRDGLH
jgi:histidinol dehydrogenase